MKRLIAKVSLYDQLKTLQTRDYQNRGGNYPESDVPDSINIMTGKNNDECFVDADFKNTDEKTASRWLQKYLEEKGFKVSSITTQQDGDYADDWVSARALIKE